MKSKSKRILLLFFLFVFFVFGLVAASEAFAVTLTSPLDCTKGTNLSGSGYEWNNAAKTLTLSGDLSVSSGSAILLPDGATIRTLAPVRVTGSISSTGTVYLEGRYSLFVRGIDGNAFSVGNLRAESFRLFSDEQAENPLSAPIGTSVFFSPISYRLTITSTGGGTVNANGETFFAGDLVSIDAMPNEGYLFGGWKIKKGDIPLEPTSPIQSFAMPDSDVELEAVFSEDNRTFTVEIEYSDMAGGRTSFLKKDFQVGERVTILATPSAGYLFKGWNSSDVTLSDPNAQSINFVMPEKNVTIYVNFEPETFYFSITTTGGGTVEVGGKTPDKNGKYAVNPGEEVALYAIPKEDYVFGGWSATNGADFDDLSADSVIMICPARDFVVRAQFASTIKKLTIAEPVGGKVVPSPGTSDFGVDCILDLSATPDEGYEFVEWKCSSEKGFFADPQNPDTTFTMPEDDCTVEAVFAKGGYRLLLSASPGGTVSTVAPKYEMGQIAEIIATPLSGYVFSYWECEEEGIIADPYSASTTLTMPGKELKVRAVFVLAVLDGSDRSPSEEEGSRFPWAALLIIFLISAVFIALLIVRDRYNLSYRYLIKKAFTGFFSRLKK